MSDRVFLTTVTHLTFRIYADRCARSGAAAVFRVACSIRRSTPSGAVKACQNLNDLGLGLLDLPPKVPRQPPPPPPTPPPVFSLGSAPRALKIDSKRGLKCDLRFELSWGAFWADLGSDLGGQVELFWPHFGYFLVSCFRDRFRSDFRSLLAQFWEPSWGRKTTKTIGGLLKIRISALPRRSTFRDPSRPRFGIVLAPKMELKSLPRRLPKRPRKRYPKGTPSRGENEPQDPPGTPPKRAKIGPKSPRRAPKSGQACRTTCA